MVQYVWTRENSEDLESTIFLWKADSAESVKLRELNVASTELYLYAYYTINKLWYVFIYNMTECGHQEVFRGELSLQDLVTKAEEILGKLPPLNV